MSKLTSSIGKSNAEEFCIISNLNILFKRTSELIFLLDANSTLLETTSTTLDLVAQQRDAGIASTL